MRDDYRDHVTMSPPMRAHLVRGPGGQHLVGDLAEVSQHAQLTAHTAPGSYSYCHTATEAPGK